MRVDTADAKSVEDGLQEAKARFGRLHSIVYAMGADISMTFVANIDPAEWQRTIDGDLNGFFRVVKAALPLLRAGGGGSIVAVTSAGLDRQIGRAHV